MGYFLVKDHNGNSVKIEAKSSAAAIEEAQEEYGFTKIAMCLPTSKPKELTQYMEA